MRPASSRDPTGREGEIGSYRVLLAAPRGYCAGVDRAVTAVEIVLDRCGPPVYVRNQIVHNRHVVTALERRGAIFVTELDEVPPGAVVVFSAHGVSPDVRAEAAARELVTIDATCPLVTKVHNEARRFAAEGYDILLIGHPGHDEIVGTLGEAPAHITVVNESVDLDEVQVSDPDKVVWLSQTTLTPDEVAGTVAGARARFPVLRDPPSDDICYAAHNRQAAVRRIAPRAELVLVVGSANSHNSNRLVQVALDAGAGAAHLVDTADGIDERWLDGVATVGVTSGASVPEILVRDVLAWLATHGYTDVEEVRTMVETQTFALPRDLPAPP